MGLIRFNARRVIHMTLEDTTDDTLPRTTQIFSPFKFRVTESTVTKNTPMGSCICVLTCSSSNESIINELLTLTIVDCDYDVQHRADFVTPSNIQISTRLFIPKGGDVTQAVLRIPKVYQHYLVKNFRFNLYVMETFEGDRLNHKELYTGGYLGEIINA